MSLRLAVAAEDFGVPLRSAISAAAENPVHGIRFNARTEVRAAEFGDTALRQLRLYVEEHRMRVAGLLYSSRHSVDNPASLDERLEGIRAAMTMVRRLGTSEVIVRVGSIPDPDAVTPVTPSNAPSNSDVDSLRNPFSFAPSVPVFPTGDSAMTEAKKFDGLCQILNDLAAFGSRHGAELVLQLSVYPLTRISRLLARIQGGRVGIVFDSATCIMSGSDPVRTFRDIYSVTGCARLRDATRDIDGGGLEVRHGEGLVDWTELIPTLTESAFPHWACIERTGGDQRSDDVSHAVASLQRILPSRP